MYLCVCVCVNCTLIISYVREHAKNFRSEDEQGRIEGKKCVVTGANSGIGSTTAEGLAARFDFLAIYLPFSTAISYKSYMPCFFVFLKWSNGVYSVPEQGEGRGCTLKDPVCNGQ